MRGLRFLELGLTSSLLMLSCERKAPGPAECLRFAEEAVSMSADNPLVQSRAEQEVDEETRRCLTTPYDRALLACVERTRQGRACFAEFKLRTRAPASVAQ
jgi:hypothetical protein